MPWWVVALYFILPIGLALFLASKGGDSEW